MGGASKQAGPQRHRTGQKKLAADPLAVFELRLARELGMTRETLLETMSQSEFLDWLALQSIDPFFDPWMANALNCQTVAAAIGGSKIKVDAFLPVKPKKRKQSPEQLKAALRRRIKKK